MKGELPNNSRSVVEIRVVVNLARPDDNLRQELLHIFLDRCLQ